MSEMSGEAVSGTVRSGTVPSGIGRIDDALARLDRLDELPVDAHPDIYDQIHAGLRNALANAGRDEDPAQGS